MVRETSAKFQMIIIKIDSIIEEIRRQIKNNDFEKAFISLNEIKSLKKPYINVDVLRARCFIKMNQTIAAKQALLEELSYFPDNAEAIDLLAQINVKEDKRFSDDEFNKLLDIVWPYTMLSQERLFSLFTLGKDICNKNIAGNFVECGVARGGSSAVLAYVISIYSKQERYLYACDSFEGMPEPAEYDWSYGQKATLTGWGAGTCTAPIESLLNVCKKLGVENLVKPARGLFHNTLPNVKNDIKQISLLHVDGDWYESTKAIFCNLFPIVTDDGFIQVDDYGHWEGCRKALHEYETTNRLSFDLNPIDATGIWFKKKATLPKSDLKLLNLGCGDRYHPGWTNVDFHSTGPDVLAHDLRQRLPFADDSFDVVYHSHVLEHLPKFIAPIFLHECYRVLKPSGIIRLAVPDLEQISRLYIDLLELACNGDLAAQARYDWIMLELLDQAVRNESGGDMAKYWMQNPMPAEDFVIARVGSEAVAAIDKVRRFKGAANEEDGVLVADDEDFEAIGKFRVSGEVHRWMYDRFSARRLLQNSGFREVRRCKADESAIPNFNVYSLDIERNGAVRKPDSLYMEAMKPLHESDTDRVTRLVEVDRLNSKLSAVKSAVSKRGYVPALEARLKESEADRAARLTVIHELDDQLKALSSDRAVLEDAYYRIKAELKDSELDRAARLDLIHSLQAQLQQYQADQATRQDLIHRLETELRQSRAGLLWSWFKRLKLK